jgi:MFS family permease
MLIYVSNGYIFYGLTYLELFPDYLCPPDIPKCDHTDKCNHPGIAVDWSSPRSLHNWVETLSLECKPNSLLTCIGAETYKVGLLGSMYFAGWTASCIFVPRLSDIYGRKIPSLISAGVSIPIYIGLILSRSLTLSISLFFLLGLTCTGKASTAYVYLLEFIP